MISRLLWPARTASAPRGEAVRTELQAPAESPLRMSGVRDQITGWDEAYEDWLATLPEAGYVDMNLMPAGTMLGSRRTCSSAVFDPDTLLLRFRGQPVDLQKLSEAIRDLDRSVQGWLRTHQPW